MTEAELKFAFDRWINRSVEPTESLNSNNLLGGPPQKAVIMSAMLEHNTLTHTFDVSIEKKVITRIDPKLRDEFPFIFHNIDVGDSPAKVAMAFELSSIDKWRAQFHRLIDASGDLVAFAHMRWSDVQWVLKMWKEDDDTIRVMYIRELHQKSVGRLLLEANGSVSNKML